MPPPTTIEEDEPTRGPDEATRVGLMLGDLSWTFSFTMASAVLGVGLELLEAGLVDRAQVAGRPFDIFAIHYELLIASFGVLYTAHAVAPRTERGRLNEPLFFLLGAAAVAYISTAVAGLYFGDQPAGFAYLAFRVVLPDLAGISSLVWSALAARLAARRRVAGEYGA